MSALSEWLKLMLAEIARKQDELEHAREETTRRAQEGDMSSREPGERAPGVGKLSNRDDG